ncbi:MAG TPA: Asp-tRNA(Asn)/Glu-tRNA(Gln) amidotransferase subunit GatC [Alphaproteobacteria bacterium]|nr:Asp-tRNA(Asn)/Glu-tRNA(Gln) amidotransferase subunit GatC [Alphaproteobacteria bacterium]
MALDQATVARIANLARIKVSDDELQAWASDLTAIIDFVEQLDEVNTEGVEPMTGVGDFSLPMRPDVVTDGGYADAVTSNAPEGHDHFFAVPKVVE